MIPLSRVQEIDRKAMPWLIRQPGETIAERGGNRQRIQAVAREENFDTLENRVLLSYARLAGVIAREYAGKYVAVRGSLRVKLVVAVRLKGSASISVQASATSADQDTELAVLLSGLRT